jgi:hypothetical protein
MIGPVVKKQADDQAEGQGDDREVMSPNAEGRVTDHHARNAGHGRSGNQVKNKRGPGM